PAEKRLVEGAHKRAAARVRVRSVGRERLDVQRRVVLLKLAEIVVERPVLLHEDDHVVDRLGELLDRAGCHAGWRSGRASGRHSAAREQRDQDSKSGGQPQVSHGTPSIHLGRYGANHSAPRAYVKKLTGPFRAARLTAAGAGRSALSDPSPLTTGRRRGRRNRLIARGPRSLGRWSDRRPGSRFHR